MKKTLITLFKLLLGKNIFINLKSIFLIHKFQNLSAPKTYNEKVNYRKLHQSHPLYGLCSNKYFVKFYVASTIGNQYTLETFWIGKKLSRPILDNINEGFAIKITNSSGKQNYLLVEDKSSFDLDCIISKFNKNVSFKYGKYSEEPWYDKTENLIMIEKLLSEKLHPIYEIKIYCFNGPNGFDAIIRIIKDRSTSKTNAFYDLQWNLLNLTYMNNKNHLKEKKPLIVDEVINLSRILSKPFDHVRLDFLIQKDRIYLGEMTFADTSGFIKFDSNYWDNYFGNKWNQIKN